MNGSPDILTILLVVLAIVIFLRLRSVLGRRTGNERPPIDFRTNEKARQNGEGEDNVVPLPRAGDRGEPQPAETGTYGRQDTAEDRIRDFLPAGGPTAEGLTDVARADPMFYPKEFLNGAKQAYEMIVTAFADGNRKILQQLLAADVYEGFEMELDAREDRGELVDTNFVGINRADIIDADMRDDMAHVQVKFISQLITAIRDRDGKLLDGDPNQVREVTDIWTFARDVTSGDPNWKLVATQAAH